MSKLAYLYSVLAALPIISLMLIFWANLRLDKNSFESAKSKRNFSTNSRSLKLGSAFNCDAIFKGKRSEIRKAERFLSLDKLERFEAAENCDNLLSLKLFNYTEFESNFPISYSILAFKNFEQTMQLLRNIYRPWNMYCIHVDKKSDANYFARLKNISAFCTKNLILPENRETVRWGHISVVQAALNCFQELLKHQKSWKYLLNIAATDFPLKSNREIVEYLRSLNELSDIEDLPITDSWKFENSFQGGATFAQLLAVKQSLKNGSYPYKKRKAPHGLTVHKGSFSGGFSRDFVEFILHSKISKDFLAWLDDTYIPDELFWSTLYHDYFVRKNVPAKPEHQFRVRYTHWGNLMPTCGGYYEHGLCVFGVADLKWLRKRKELFAHKFDSKMQPTTLDCLEEYISNKH